MRKYKYTVAIDIDGVIADFEGEFCDRFGDKFRELPDLFSRYPEIDPLIISEFVGSPDTYRNLAPLFGGFLLTQQARGLGLYTVLMTSRPKHLAEVTREWLESHYIVYNEIWHVQNKALAIQDYNNLYPNRPIKALVDDLESSLTKLPTGVVGIAMEAPWNSSYPLHARYNAGLMRLEWNEGGEWKPFWEDNGT